MKKQGELVRFTTQDVSKAIPVASSLTIANEFNKQHKTVLNAIKNLYEDLKESIDKEDLGRHKIVPSYYFNKQGKEQPLYLVNEDFFMMLVMGFTGKKALFMKNEFVKSFILMRNELNARIETRHIGKVARFSLTDSIKNNVGESGRFKSYAYGNYTKIIYKKVLGMTVKKFKEKHDIPKDDNIRDYLSIKTLQEVQELESKVATIIEFSKCKNNKEVYAEIKTYLNNYSLLA